MANKICYRFFKLKQIRNQESVYIPGFAIPLFFVYFKLCYRFKCVWYKVVYTV